MFEGFTNEARRVVEVAQEEARDLHHPFVGTEHLLLGLLREQDAIAERVLERLRVPLETVRREVAERVGDWGMAPAGLAPFTPRAKKVLKTARVVGHGVTGTEHLWVGIDVEREGVAAEVLTDLGISLGAVRAIILSTFRERRGDGWTAYGLVKVGGYRPNRLERLWYRHPGRWASPVVAWLNNSVPVTRGRVGWISRPPHLPLPPVPGSTMAARRRAVADRLEHGAPVGSEWTVTIVQVGRGPEPCAKAYEILEDAVSRFGIELNYSRVQIESIQTNQGPGLRLVYSHRFDNPEAGGK